MINLLETEGILYKFGSILADIFVLSFLWLIFSLPIVTVGASTTALYYVCTKKAQGIDVYILKSFWQSFKEGMIKSTLVLLTACLIGWVIWINFHALDQINMGKGLTFSIRVALFIALIQVIFILMYAFPIVARFELSFFEVLKVALQLSNRHLILTISNLVLFVAICLVTIWIPFLFIFISGMYIYLSSSIFVRIFRKYEPNFK